MSSMELPKTAFATQETVDEILSQAFGLPIEVVQSEEFKVAMQELEA